MKIQDCLNILELVTGIYSQSEIKKAYKKVSLKFHPDRNPAGVKMMQVINEAFETLKTLGDNVTSNSTEAGENYSEELNNALNAVMVFEDLIIEICGNWIWVSGNTKAHKDDIKSAKFRWSKNKTAWYFRPAEYASKNRKSCSMDQIREMHGSKAIRTNSRTKITA